MIHLSAEAVLIAVKRGTWSIICSRRILAGLDCKSRDSQVFGISVSVDCSVTPSVSLSMEAGLLEKFSCCCTSDSSDTFGSIEHDSSQTDWRRKLVSSRQGSFETDAVPSGLRLTGSYDLAEV